MLVSAIFKQNNMGEGQSHEAPILVPDMLCDSTTKLARKRIAIANVTLALELRS